MAYKLSAGQSVSDINVTPMVDVMLVLLIIFMVITPMLQKGVTVDLAKTQNPRAMRSEEHTSKLQSRLHLVCRLLLEKKKKPNTRTHSCDSDNMRRHVIAASI